MTQISSFAMATLTVLLMFLILSSSVNGTLINVQNKCGQVLTACDAAGGKHGKPGTPGFIPTSCYVLGASGGSRLRDFGSKWTAGFIWGFPGSNTDPGLGDQAKTVANKMEMTTNGHDGQHSYNLSNVDGYNLPLLVKPTSDVTRSGRHCGTLVCQIPNLNQVCRNPNFFSGFPALGCKNVDGRGKSSTRDTRSLKNHCQTSYSLSSENIVFGCETRTN